MAINFYIKDANQPAATGINYNGKNLPQDAKTYTPPPVDLTNNPSLITIGAVTLPGDTAIYINGTKQMIVDKILDGVSVIEHVSRMPYELEFECTIRTMDPNFSTNGLWIFPQDDLDKLWSNLWLPDTVQKVQNTYLNKLGIQEMVIDKISPTTIRGSKNVPLRISGYENVPGQTLIVP